MTSSANPLTDMQGVSLSHGASPPRGASSCRGWGFGPAMTWWAADAQDARWKRAWPVRDWQLMQMVFAGSGMEARPVWKIHPCERTSIADETWKVRAVRTALYCRSCKDKDKGTLAYVGLHRPSLPIVGPGTIPQPKRCESCLGPDQGRAVEFFLRYCNYCFPILSYDYCSLSTLNAEPYSCNLRRFTSKLSAGTESESPGS